MRCSKTSNMRNHVLSWILAVFLGQVATGSILRHVLKELRSKSSCNLHDLPGGIGSSYELCEMPLGNDHTTMTCSVKNETNGETYRYRCFNGRWILPAKVTAAPTHHREKRFVQAALIAVGKAVAVEVGTQLIGKALEYVFCLFFCDDEEAEPINKPPQITCYPPATSEIFADAGKVSTDVEWPIPTASDPDGGTPSITPETSSGTFNRGSHTVLYTASDGELQDMCVVSFAVKVRTCPPLAWPRNGYKSCDHNEIVYGTTCTFGCNDGFELDGSSLSECGENRQFNHDVPACVRINCSSPGLPTNGEAVCSDLTNYGYQSTCMTQCVPGYETQTFVFSRCLVNKKWSAVLPPCIDAEIPTFANCPTAIYWQADRGHSSAFVAWDPIVVEDNEDISVVANQIQGLHRGSEFPEGSTMVEYRADDAAGNSAYPCIFPVIVKATRCQFPRFQDKFLDADCPADLLHGSSCTLSCQGNFPLVGTETIVCEMDGITDADWGYWDWGNSTEPYCQQNPCDLLTAPRNGGIACDKWTFGKMCTMSCNAEFDIPAFVVSTSGQFSGLFTCGEDTGSWIPTNDVPDCSEIKSSFAMNLPSTLYYYSGNCVDAIDEIKSNFISIMEGLQTTYFPGICPDTNTCNVDNVSVTCGPTSRRRRRRKRESTSKVFVKFDFTVSWVPSLSSVIDDANRHNAILLELAGTSHTKKAAGYFDIPGYITGEFDYVTIGAFRCPEGMFPGTRPATCAGCPPGWEYNRDYSNCTKCPVGKFHEDAGSLFCTLCPSGKSTLTIGAKNESQCIDICQAGQFSVTGLSPCSACPLGNYQPLAHMQDCIACPDGKTTVAPSATADTDCLDFDMKLNSGESSVVLTPLTSVLSDFSLSTWTKMTTSASDLTILQLFSDGIQHARVAVSSGSLVVDLSGHSVNSEVPVPAGIWTHVAVTWDAVNSRLTVYLNGQSEFSQVVAAVTGFVVPIESDIRILSSSTGENILSNYLVTGISIGPDVVQDLSRTCNGEHTQSLYTMKDILLAATTRVDVIAPSRCDAFDDCLSSPCNGHACINSPSGYTCKCPNGFTGQNCEVFPNHCANHECMNGSTCRNEETDYICECSYGYSGKFCENRAVDGQWGNWTDSSCSITCGGGGTRKRTRQCDSPPPDPEGQPCEGEPEEISSCFTSRCPVCPDLPVPPTTEFICNQTAEVDMQICTLRCKSGKVFPVGMQSRLTYECGKRTGYKWTHQTAENPLGRLPGCSEAKGASQMTAVSSASYLNNDIPCSHAQEKLQENIQMLSCVQNQTCSAQVALSHCAGQPVRKRSTDQTQAVISLTVDLQDGVELDLEAFLTSKTISPNLLALVEAVATLEVAAQEIQNNTAAVYNLDINDVLYTINSSSLQMSGEMDCPDGTVATEGVCVTCPAGTQFHDGWCIWCPGGTYQDLTAQSTCKACPSSFTTYGVGATSVSDCIDAPDSSPMTTSSQAGSDTSTVYHQIDDELPVTIGAIVSCLVVAGILIAVVAFAVRYYKRKKSRDLKGSFLTISKVHPSVSDLKYEAADTDMLNRYVDLPAVCSSPPPAYCLNDPHSKQANMDVETSSS